MKAAGPRRRPRRPTRLRRRGAAHAIPPHAPDAGDGDTGLLDRPDGWYWLAPDGRQVFGPFDSAERARADRDRASEESVDEAETEREAELELGVAAAVQEGTQPVSDSDEPDLGPRPR